MNFLRNLRIALSVSIIFSNCSRFATEKFVFYDRTMGGINEVYTYSDYIKITNYSNKSMTARRMYEYAKTYIDSVKADKTVRRVIFVGVKPLGSLPKGGIFEDPSNKVRRSCLLDFSFADSLNFISSKRNNIHLYTATIWKKGEHKTYYCIFPQGKATIDSLLNSKEPFDNGF